MIKPFQHGRVFAVSLGHLFHDVYAAFLSPVIPLLVEKLGISLSMAGLLDVIRNIPSVFNPFIGLLIEGVRVKYLVIFMPGITATVMSLLGIAPSYAMVVILVLTAGISSAFFHLPSPGLVKKFAGDKTGAGMSYYMLGGELSRTLGPLIITGAISLWGFEGTWRLIPFGAAASGILYWRLKDYKEQVHLASASKRPKAGTALKEVLPELVFIALFLFFTMAIKISVTLYLTAYLVDHGRTLMSASFMLSLLQFAGAAGTLLAGHVSDRLGKKTTLLSSAAACPVLMWLFLVSGQGWQVPIIIGLGFFIFAPGPVILALVQDAGPRFPSFVNGLYMTIEFAVRSSIVVLVGLGIDHLGFKTTYTFSALLGLGAVLLILFFPAKRVFQNEPLIL